MQSVKKFIGDKAFYKMVLLLAVPIMIQNGVTTFVSLLDNFMVGRLGTNQLTGVAIINQLIFVFNLCIFGGVSGAGIFSAQYWGQKDHKGVRDTFRFKLVICAIVTLLSFLILWFGREKLIGLYLHENNDPANLQATFGFSEQYLLVMIAGLIPFAISQAYGSTLREIGETVIPMVSSVAAVIINVALNAVLIFGLFGFPQLGVQGAATATVIARFVECLIVVIFTHTHSAQYIFIQGVYKNFKIPGTLIKKILMKGTPLILNETLWAAGMATLNQCYSIKGLSVVAGLSISSTIANLFNVVFIALGSAISIIVGPLLGAGKMKEAKETAYKMIFFSVAVCIGMGGIMALIAPIFPSFYKTTAEVKQIAAVFIRISAFCMPMFAYLHATYFTIRSGGKTVITFLFDSVYLWVISVPTAYLLIHYSELSIVGIYIICQMMDLIKCLIGTIMLKKDIWIQNLIEA